MLRPSVLFFAFLFLASPLTISQNAGPQPRTKGTQNLFEDDRVRVEIPTGWWVQPATEHVSGDRPFELPIGALLTKGKYRLYLLTHREQASGVEGGRFSEVAEYIFPWMDISESPCPSEIQGSEAIRNNTLTRQDLYFDTAHASKKALADCGNPNVKATLWYGSYFVEKCQSKDTPRACGGFFLTYQDLSGKPPLPRTVNRPTTSDEWQMVYALSFDTKTPDALPVKDDPGLRTVLREASGIVDSIVYK